MNRLSPKGKPGESHFQQLMNQVVSVSAPTNSCLIHNTDKRTSAWLKLKKDYVLGVGDSLDLVPIGAWHGNGRKAAWWSPILLAIWDEISGQFIAVCKCMSGMINNPVSVWTILKDSTRFHR